MKITRYFQSCLLVEEEVGKILIDPSTHEKEHLEDFGQIDAVLFTHEHSDHFDPEIAKAFADKGVPVYANASTAKQIKAQRNVVVDKQEFTVKYWKIKALELPHCLMWDGSKGPQNTGYLLNNYFLHPGDSTEVEGLNVNALACPINGPDVSWKDAFNLCKQTSAKNVVPVHFDYLGGNPEVFAQIGAGMNIEVHPLKAGESVDL